MTPYQNFDLEYNRAGNLSPAQKEKLSRNWKTAMRIGGAFAVFMILLGIVFHITGDPMGLYATWAVGLVVGLGLIWMGRTMQIVQNDGSVSSVEGIVQREIITDEGSSTYYLHVDDLRLMMQESDYHCFEDGRIYRVYFVARTSYLVSAEAGET